MAMGPQHRLSGGDLDDERIGASRSRTDIANFFASTRVEALRDGDGETLAQVRDRVLGAGLAAGIRVPMFTHTAGWLRLDVRGGRSIGEHWQLMVAAENLMDRHLSRPRLRHGCGGRKCLCQPAFPLVGAGRARAQ